MTQQCGVCGAFIRPGWVGACTKCGSDWDNGPQPGPCAKRTVTCRIESQHPSGDTEYVEATNWCANPQPVCPRANGEDYTKCRTICRQSGHAETNAVALAKKAGISTRGAIATISGHYWICEPCGRALRDAGISEIRIRDEARELLDRSRG